MSALNVTVTVTDPDLLIAGNSPFAPFVAAKIQLYRYTSEALARAATSGTPGGTLATTFTLVASTVAAADPNISGPYRFGYYDASQTASSWYRYMFATAGLTAFSQLSESWQSDDRDQWALRDILFEVGQLMGGSVIKGTASAGAAGSITCTKLFKSTKRDARFYEGWTVMITQDAGGASAAPEGEEAVIDSIAVATGVATLDLDLSAAVAASDVFIASAYLEPSEMIRIINRAREQMKVVAVVDIAIDTAENRYPAPYGVRSETDVVKAVGIYQYPNSNREDEFEIDYRVVFDGIRSWIELSEYPDRSAVARLTVLRSYRDLEGNLSAMGDTTSCPVEWWRPAFAFAIADYLVKTDENEPEYQRLKSEFADQVPKHFAPQIERQAKRGAGREIVPGPRACP
jgi:hypothetical protein